MPFCSWCGRYVLLTLFSFLFREQKALEVYLFIYAFFSLGSLKLVMKIDLSDISSILHNSNSYRYDVIFSS